MYAPIPPRTIIAPIAMISAELPVKPLPLPAVVLVEIVGAAVVEVVGIDTLGWGKPGDSGLPPGDCAAAADGSKSAVPRSAARRTRIVFNACPGRSYASGCSIAGVSGAST